MYERQWERVTADQIGAYDLIAEARTHTPNKVSHVESVGAKSRWIVFESGERIRPRHTKKFWRVLRGINA